MGLRTALLSAAEFLTTASSVSVDPGAAEYQDELALDHAVCYDLRAGLAWPTGGRLHS